MGHAARIERKGAALDAHLPQTHTRWRAAIRRAALALCALLIAATAAQARTPYPMYTAVGGARSVVSGGPDGNTVYTDNIATGPNIYGGQIQDGAGLMLVVGARANDYVGGEVMLIDTQHRALYNAAPANTQPMDAEITSVLAVLRVTAPLGDSVELFGRAGWGDLAVVYGRNTNSPPDPAFTSASFGGHATVAGAGVQFDYKRVGLELGVLRQKGRLGTVDANAAGKGVNIPRIDIDVTNYSVLFVWHWGLPHG